MQPVINLYNPAVKKAGESQVGENLLESSHPGYVVAMGEIEAINITLLTIALIVLIKLPPLGIVS